MFFYKSHLGGFYSSPDKLKNTSLCCDGCGDSDYELGQADTLSDAWKLLASDSDGISINGSGGRSLQYLYPRLLEYFYPKVMPKVNYDGFSILSDDEIIERLKRFFKKEGNNPEELVNLAIKDKEDYD